MTSLNYAEQVLREAEEEAVRLKQEKQQRESGKEAAATVVSRVVKLNLSDEGDFPSLGGKNGGSGGSVKKTQPTWMVSSVSDGPVTVATPPVLPSGTISRVFHLPADHQRRLRDFASLADLTASVMKSTGTFIDASTSAQTKTTTFVIRGKESDVIQAKRLIWSNLAQNGTMEVEVPLEVIKFIIGPGGRNLQAIQAESSTKIRIPKNEEWNGKVSITGDFEGVAMARERILAIVKERTSKLSVHVEIEKIPASFLLKEESEVSLQSLNAKYPNLRINKNVNDSHVSLNISGDREEVLEVQAALNAAIEKARNEIKSVGTQIPKNLHRFLIGPKASILHQIEAESGCVVVVPALDSDSDQVKIYGSDDLLLQGLAAVLEKTANLTSQQIPVQATMLTLLQNHQKYRDEIRAIETLTEVSFHATSTGFDIDGKRELVLKALGEFNSLMNRLKASLRTDVLTIDPDYLKHVIGKKGQTVQQLQKDFNVDIVIAGEDQVVFAGSEIEQVKAAREHVQSMLVNLADLQTVTAKIESKYHGMLIGTKGANLKTYQEKYPSVLIKFPQGEDDKVVFKGSKGEVEKCRDEMVAQAEVIRHDLIMHSYIQSIKLDKEKVRVLREAKNLRFLQNFCRQQDVKLLADEASLEVGKEISLQGVKKQVDSLLPLFIEQLNTLADQDSLTFNVDPQYHGLLIGSEGKNLKHLVQKYSVRINFPKKNVEESGEEQQQQQQQQQETVSDEVDLSLIKVIGPKANIAKAKEELLELLDYHLTHSHKESLRVPQASISMIVGRGGAIIDEIREETDTQIDIERKEKDGEGNDEDVLVTVEVTGTKEGVKSAKSRIERIVKEFREQSEMEVKPPSKVVLESLLHTFRREYRKFLDQWQSQGLMISAIPKKDLVIVRGKSALVQESVDQLVKLFEAIESKELITEELSLPSRFYGTIIGPGGATIKHLMTEFDVDILIPRSSSVDESVKLFGRPANIHAVIQKLREIARTDKLFRFPTRSLKDTVLGSVSSQLKALPVDFDEHARGGVHVSGDFEKVNEAVAILARELERVKALEGTSTEGTAAEGTN